MLNFHEFSDISVYRINENFKTYNLSKRIAHIISSETKRRIT